MNNWVRAEQTVIVIVGHRRPKELQTALAQWSETTPRFHYIYVIANHPTTMDGIKLPGRTAVLPSGRIPAHVGQLSPNWNNGFQWAFWDKEVEWCLCSQDDMTVKDGWLALVNSHEADLYTAPAGDMAFLLNRRCFREVGWFDEHIRTIGGHDMDWIARAILALGESRVVLEDRHGHGWEYNPIGLAEFWQSSQGGAKAGASYAMGGALDRALKKVLHEKWGITGDDLRRAMIAHKVPQPVYGEFDWYPWFARK